MGRYNIQSLAEMRWGAIVHAVSQLNTELVPTPKRGQPIAPHSSVIALNAICLGCGEPFFGFRGSRFGSRSCQHALQRATRVNPVCSSNELPTECQDPASP